MRAAPAGASIWVGLSERRNLVFAGTMAVRGRGVAVVGAIGMDTEAGRVAGLARGAEAAS